MLEKKLGNPYTKKTLKEFPKVPIIFYGQYPRSEELVTASRAFDRSELTLDKLKKIQGQDRRAFISLQQGLPYLNTGLFHIDDLMRPFNTLIPGAKPGPLTRFFETNMFWRSLEVKGKVTIKEDTIDQWILEQFLPGNVSTQDPIVFTLPFFFLFKEFSTGFSPEAICTLLQTISKRLNAFSKGILIFYEPLFGWRNFSEDEKGKAWNLLYDIKQICKLPVAVMQSFFSLKADLNYFYSLPVDGLGIDFFNNPIKGVLDHFPKDKFLLAGIMNIDSTFPEEKEQIEAFFSKTAPYIPRENIFITTSGPAELLPRETMDLKAAHMKKHLNQDNAVENGP